MFDYLINCYNYTVSAKGADLTIESDSGYSPLALAVALGHKKSRYHFVLYKRTVFF